MLLPTWRVLLRLFLAVAAALPLLALPARGASNELEFIQKLRERGFYDYAILEIDRAKGRPGVSEEKKGTFEFERAVTQLEYGYTLVNAESQSKELERAAKTFEQFASRYPTHPLVGKANSQRGQLLLDRARAAVWSLERGRADNPAKQAEMRANARSLIAASRDIFQTIRDKAKEEFDRFPKAGELNPEQREARKAAQSAYLRALLNLAACSFEEGMSYEPNAAERTRALTKAAKEFEQIHVENRLLGAGLRAQLWQARAFEELGDIRKAMGVYDELLLNRDDKNELVREVGDLAMQFHLSCLNEHREKESVLVLNDATRWLISAKDRKRSRTGLAIRWQRAVAAERLAASKEATAADRERYTKLAAADAREVSSYPGEFQKQALSLVTRLAGEVGTKTLDQRDFNSGLLNARKTMDDIQSILERVDSASNEQKPKLERALKEKLQEAALQLRRVLASVAPNTKALELNRARYFLAFVDYQLKANDEAAILGEYAARRLRILDHELALEAARVAMAAYKQEFDVVSEPQREGIARLARSLVEFMVHQWPDHERTNEARIALAGMFERSKNYLEAARWYAAVTPGDQYAEAQVGAGRVYWIAVQLIPEKMADGASRKQTVTEMTSKAEEFLSRGIERAGDPADSAGNPPNWLVVGKVALANIEIGQSRYNDAEKLLTSPPHSVVESIAVSDEAARPAEGVKGRTFASYAYQTLLRVEIGRHRIDASLSAMQQLEKIAGATGAEGVTAIYVSLGKEIQKEIGRLNATQDRARLTEVRKSFERFLEELSARSASMTYGSLLWIAETYTGLGEGMSDDRAAAREYFGKGARAYEQLIARVSEDKTSSSEHRFSLQLRLANCLRRQGDFERALAIVREVIAQRSKALDVQFLAAGILEDWGTAETSDAPAHSLESIYGLHAANGHGAVWGWAEIAARLQRLLAAGKADPEYREKYFNARYNIPLARRHYALAQRDSSARNKALEVALGEISAFALVSSDISDDSWRRLEALYVDLEKDLGRNPEPLRRPDLRAAAPPPQAEAGPIKVEQQSTTAAAGTANANSVGAPAAVTPPAAPPSGKGWIVLGLVAALAAGGAAVWNVRKQASSAPRRVTSSFGPPDFLDLPTRSTRRRTSSEKLSTDLADIDFPIPADGRATQKRSAQQGTASGPRRIKPKHNPPRP